MRAKESKLNEKKTQNVRQIAVFVVLVVIATSTYARELPPTFGLRITAASLPEMTVNRDTNRFLYDAVMGDESLPEDAISTAANGASKPKGSLFGLAMTDYLGRKSQLKLTSNLPTMKRFIAKAILLLRLI